MQYADVLRELYAATRNGMDFGIERMERCIADLAIPAAPHTMQIAGTNGKGSTANFIASILAQAGIQTGVFSSPHLTTIRERFRICRKNITRDQFVNAYAALGNYTKTLTFFEQITAIAAWLFSEESVVVSIYEVGLGGRLDSTTGIIADIGIVTGIAMDHCEYLGHSLSAIAAEKAAIFRKGSPAIIGLSAPDAIRKQLAEHARHRHSEVHWVNNKHTTFVPELKLLGEHQRENAAAAVAGVLALRERGLTITDSDIRAGLENATLRGRLEEITESVWVDGAHNAQAASVLAAATRDWTPLVLVVGLSKGKDIAAFLAPFLGRDWTIIATQARNERAQHAEKIAEISAQLGFQVPIVEPKIERALQRAQSIAKKRRILITGSLLLVGDVLAILCADDADPVFVTDPSGGVAPMVVGEYP